MKLKSDLQMFAGDPGIPDIPGNSPIIYEHILKNGNKVQVDSAIRDGNGVRIDTNYAKKTELPDVSAKMDKANPTGTGSLSLNRKADTTIGQYSVAEGYNNEASGNFSHAEGTAGIASGMGSHAEGGVSIASGDFSHAEGFRTRALSRSQHTFGEYNILDSAGTQYLKGTYVEIVGNGIDEDARSNARTLDWNGNEVLAGSQTATSFIKTGGTSSQFLKADGSVDSSTYLTQHQDISGKQDKTDSSLQTAATTVVGAINEVNSIAKQANKAEGFASYSALITALNSASATEYNVGQSFYIQTLNVPDLWIIGIESSSSSYTYTTDAAFITATSASGGQQVGYYKLAQLETQKVDLSNYSTKAETVSNVSYNSSSRKLQKTINGSTTDVVTFGANAFTSTTIPTNPLTYSDTGTYNVAGTNKTTYTYAQTAIYAPNGLIMGGTAAAAGLVTRGICGVGTPSTGGACSKDNLYINYDSDNTYRNNRQLILQAGTTGTHYGNNLYQFAAARGDAVKGYCDATYVDKTSAQTVSGVKTFSNGLKIGDATLSYDSTNKCLKVIF